MKKILTIFFTLINLFAFAQKPNTKYGEFSIEELTMTKCPFDTTADAVVLCEWGKYSFDNDFTLDLHHYKRIKILKESGLKYANQTVEFNFSYQTIDNVYATVNTLGKDGKLIKTEVDKSLLHYSNVVSYLNKLTISFPKVEVGSIIEFHYTTSSRVFYMPTWFFQNEIPTIFSEVTIENPDFFRYVSLATGNEIDKGLLKKEEHQSSSIQTINSYKYNQIKSYTLTDVPSIKLEPKCRSKYEDWDKIKFFPKWYNNHHITFDTWKQEVYHLLHNDPGFFIQLTSTPSMDKLLINSGLKDWKKPKFEKMVGIQKLVSQTMHWDGTYNMLTKTGIDDAFKKREGNSAEINFILLGLLKEAGLKPTPVLLSTREHGGFYQEIVTTAFINNVMAMVTIDSTDYILDATSRMPFNMLPLQCTNVEALIADEENPKIVFIDCVNDFTSTDKIKINLTDKGILQYKTKRILENYSKEDFDNQIKKIGKDDCMKNLLGKSSGVQIDSFSFENGETDSLPTEINTAYSMDANSSSIIYLEPFAFTKFENYFLSEKRISGIDLGSKQNLTYFSTIQIPNGFQFSSIPKEISFLSKDSTMNFSRTILSATDNVLRLKATITIDKSYFPATEYADVRNFYMLAANSFDDKLVIKKK